MSQGTMLHHPIHVESQVWALETLRPPLTIVAEKLKSSDPAEALTAARTIAERFRHGYDAPMALADCVPSNILFTLTYETQAILANLAIAGFPLDIPTLPANLPPTLACRYRCAEILASPSRLSLENASALDLRAVADAPVERAMTSGLWLRAATHERPAMHDLAITIMRAALSRALLSPAEAESVLFGIMRRSSEAVVARALSLAAEPWAHGLPCPVLAAWMNGEEVANAAVRLAAARKDVAWVRRFATSDAVAQSARRAAIITLGALGEASDIDILIALVEDEPANLGAEVIEALRGLKRRGVSPDEHQARRIVSVVLRHDGLSLDAAAETTNSRADTLVAAIDEHIAEGLSKDRCTRILGLFGTRKTVARLVEMAQSATDAVLSRFAIRELGSIEERSAEAVILDKLETEPEACLFALGRIGGLATVQHLRKLLDAPPRPWLSTALRILFRLDPSPSVLAAAVEHGAISVETLDALQAYACAEQTNTLAAIAAAPGHPFRTSAIGALGRTGGPLAIDSLASLLTDGDEVVRDLAKQALRTLGQRLNLPDPTISCLEGATDPGGTLVAEAALRRLRLRTASAAETALLLDVVVGHDHPHIVRVVRPLLRQENPEIRKRAITCLGAAGPACAAWILPYLRPDLPLPVTRQALVALGRAAVPGLGATIAEWLVFPNMNLKKTAAEALTSSRDPDVIPTLVEVLAFQDQPGLRQLVEKILHGLAGPYFRSLLVEKIATLGDSRKEDLLASSIAGLFSPEEIATLVMFRPSLPASLVLHAYAANADKVAELDAAFRRNGAESRIPHETDVAGAHPLRMGLARADALRCGADLRRCIGEAPFFADISPDLVASIQSAAARANTTSIRLSISEQRVLAALLPKLDAPIRQDAITLLAGTTDPIVLSRVLPFVETQGQLDLRHAPLLGAVLRRSGPEVARSLRLHSRPEIRTNAAQTLMLSGEATFTDTPQIERAALIRAWVDAGREDELLAALEGKDALPLADVVAQVAERSGSIAAMAFAQRWIAKNPSERTSAWVNLAFLGEVVEPALRELARNHRRGEVRLGALGGLSRDFRMDRAFLRSLFGDDHPGVREVAAETLMQMGDRDDHAFVLGAWLDGAFRGTFRIAIDDQDKPVFEAAVAMATTEADQLRLLGPIAALPLPTRIPFLLTLHASTHSRVSAAARDSLRALSAADVLPHIEARLRAGDLSRLDVIGSTGTLPRTLVDIAFTSDEPETWIRFCLRLAGTGLLYAGSLSESIATWAAESKSPAALSLLARLTDWYDDRQARVLLRALDSALSGAFRDAVIRTILEALRESPPILISRVLSGWVRPSDTAAIRALAEAEATSPGLLALLDPALRPAVERALDTALETADPESSRRLLTYFASRAESPSERERVLGMLERHIRSSSRRVSLHAHRLLRTLAPRDRYLRATRVLLGDSDPTTIRLAIRVLAFGGDVESAVQIAEGLSHPHTAVVRAAREGLLVLGDAAVATLLRSRGGLRPDRRAAVDAVIDEIRKRGDSA